MAAKRSAHQDPEYEDVPEQIQKKRRTLMERGAVELTKKRIETILRAQFQEEISNKDNELDEIDESLHEGRTILDRLRACIITKYYATAGQNVNEQGQSTTPSIHPSVKNYLGKTVPVLSKISNHKLKNSIENKLSLTELSLENVPRFSNTADISTEIPKPSPIRTVEVSSRASRFKTMYRVIVGNVSKYITTDHREENNHSTHKWMVYVRSDKNCQDLNTVVRKVCFLLHPSYRPNDIVEVNDPPFHLMRRGWGEFPIRVQLHFCDSRNKPVDIIHLLKLDKTYTGLQTLGSETVVVLQLFKPEEKVMKNPVISGQQSVTHCNLPTTEFQEQITLKSSTNVIKISSSECNSGSSNALSIQIINSEENNGLQNDKAEECMSSLNKQVQCKDAVELQQKSVLHERKELSVTVKNSSDPCLSIPVCSPEEPIKTTTTDSNICASQSVSSSESISNSNTANNDASKKILLFVSPSTSQSSSNNSKSSVVISQKNKGTNGLNTFVKCTGFQGQVYLVPQSHIRYPNSSTCNIQSYWKSGDSKMPQQLLASSGTHFTPQNVSLGQGKSLLQTKSAVLKPGNTTLPLYVLKTVPSGSGGSDQVFVFPVAAKSENNSALNITSTTSINSSATNGPVHHQYASSLSENCSQQIKKSKLPLHWEKALETIKIDSYQTITELIKRVVKLFPLVAEDTDFSYLPFCSPSVECFQSWHIGKQRAAEWQRAGAVRIALLKVLKKNEDKHLKTEDVWSRRDIMVWCRKNGYTPSVTGAPSVTERRYISQTQVWPASSLNDTSSLSDPKDLMRELTSQQTVYESSDEEIDIIGISDNQSVIEDQSPKHEPIVCLSPSSPAVNHVKEAASQIGIRFQSVEVDSAISVPAIEEMIFAVCKEFATDILRAAFSEGYARMGGKMPPEEITVTDVYSAVQKLPCCDFLTNCYLGVCQESTTQS